MSEYYYVGPFGRILPAEDAQNRPASPPSRLSRYQLPPRPQKTTSLIFGSDRSLCTPEQITEQALTPQEPSAQELDPSQRQDQMIPLNQLITPSPQSVHPTTGYTQSSSSPSVSGSTGPSSVSSGYGRSASQALARGMNPLSSHLGTVAAPEAFDAPYGKYSGTQRPSFSQVPLTTAVLGSTTDTDACIENRIEAPVARYHHGQLPQVPEFLNSALSPLSEAPISSAATFQPGSPTSGAQPHLAHVVDERFIEGEGLCYIYSDGTHCPKIIDGQPVNANWGITKAGKPRKRLALACITCRDKKIKCNPNVPKCDQCQKSGRECRFESAPRGNQLPAKPISKPGLAEDLDALAASQGQPPPSSTALSYQRSSVSTTNTSDISSQSAPSVSSGMIDNGLEDFARPFKRRRRMSTYSPDIPDDSSGWQTGRERGLDSFYQSNLLSELVSLDIQDPIAVAWAEDPYELHPELTKHYLDLYFEYINAGCYCMFPREAFMRWVMFCREKQLENNMLLYAILAFGSVFSDRKERRKLDGDKFQQIAKYALTKREGHLTLQVAQTRLILSLWHLARGFLSAAADLSGAAMLTVNALGLFAEPSSGSSELVQAPGHILEGEALIESRRRTYWCVFILDKLESLILGQPSVLREENIFLRLPRSEALFESGTHAEPPFFRKPPPAPDQSINDNERQSLHPLAFFIEALDVLGGVVDFQFRSSFIPAEQYASETNQFRTETLSRIDQWLRNLPPYFAYSDANMERSIRVGSIDIFIVTHITYHLTMLKLNRYCRHEDLPDQVISRNVRQIRFHALAVLRIGTALSDILHKNNPKSSGGARTDLTVHCRRAIMSVPVIGWGIVSAIDVVSAAGPMDTLPECIKLINGGLEILDHFARFFLNSGRQLNLIERRVNELIAAVYKCDGHTDNVGFAVEGPSSLDGMLLSGVLSGGRSVSHGHSVGWAGPTMYGAAASRRGDLVYNLPRDEYFRAMGLEHISTANGNIRWIRDTRTMPGTPIS